MLAGIYKPSFSSRELHMKEMNSENSAVIWRFEVKRRERTFWLQTRTSELGVMQIHI